VVKISKCRAGEVRYIRLVDKVGKVGS
jgi:hypothetical protein